MSMITPKGSLQAEALGYYRDRIQPAASVKVPQWCRESMVIAHALGSVDGRCGTNSLEALEESYERGFRVFEADIILSSDEALVLRHDFESDSYYNFEQHMDDTPVMSKNEFLNTSINGIYTPMLFETLIDFMDSHKDIYLVTDTKNIDEKTIKKQFSMIKSIVDRKNPELYERIIVQLYNYEMKAIIDDICKFENYILTIYQMANVDYNRLGRYCNKNGIAVVTMPVERVKKEHSDILHSYGVSVYTHTVNRIKLIESLHLYHNVDGFYTDYISPADVEKYKLTRKIYTNRYEELKSLFANLKLSSEI